MEKGPRLSASIGAVDPPLPQRTHLVNAKHDKAADEPESGYRLSMSTLHCTTPYSTGRNSTLSKVYGTKQDAGLLTFACFQLIIISNCTSSEASTGFREILRAGKDTGVLSLSTATSAWKKQGTSVHSRPQIEHDQITCRRTLI